MIGDERETLFGADLKLEDRAPGFDLMPGGTGDLDLVQGNDNIIQALIMHLRVRKGELALLGWPDYGSRIHELIGEPNIARTHVKLMAFADSAIKQDPRVSDIEDIRTLVLPGEQNVVRVHMEILLINQPNPLNLIYDVPLEDT